MKVWRAFTSLWWEAAVMTDLLKARLVKYFRSPLFRIAAVVSLLAGINDGIYCTYFKDEVGNVLNCPMDDMGMLTAIWALIVLVAMCGGREFSDGTIRNKIAVGHTKMSIFLTEIIVASVMAGILYLLNIVPTAIGGWFFLSAIPVSSAVKWFVNLFLVMELMGILAVSVTYLIAKRAVGVIAAFMLHFALYIMIALTGGYYDNLNEPKEYVGPSYHVYEDGTVEEIETVFTNNYYIEGFPRTLVQIEHTINPMYGLHDTAQYGYIIDQSLADNATIEEGQHRAWLLNFNIFKMTCWCILTLGVGMYLFRKKDLK